MPFRSITDFEKTSISNSLEEHMAVILLFTCFIADISEITALYYMNYKQPKDNENSQTGYSNG